MKCWVAEPGRTISKAVGGTDRLYDGADTLHGGLDNDRVWYGAVDDIFGMRPSDGTDKIIDFEITSSDKADLLSFQIAGFSILQSLRSGLIMSTRL